jgi:competence protein ComEA
MKGDERGESADAPPQLVSINPKQGGGFVKGMLTLVLTVLLLVPVFAPAAEQKAGKEPQGAVAANAAAQKVDLNRASHEDLIAVPGIGPRMAQAIIDLRAKRGSFTRIEDLLEVTGIKEKKLAALAGYVEVVPLKVSTAAAPSTPTR